MGDFTALFGIETKHMHTVSLLSGIDSTNSYLRRLSEVLPDGHLAVAGEQLSGRGRQGKSFFSPSDDGLYMSLLVKESKQVNDPLLTAKVSLAVCRAIDEVTGTNMTNGVGIKWVNDVYFGSKKLCGILCEKLTDLSGKPYVIIGIGVNIYTDLLKYPKELRNVACSLYDIMHKQCDKYKLCAFIVSELEKLLESSDNDAVLKEYRARSIVLGHEIIVIRDNQKIRAAALDICDDGALLVRYEDGFTSKLCGGEISIRVKK